jgi:hypothetical protein
MASANTMSILLVIWEVIVIENKSGDIQGNGKLVFD